jgi:hypothetical protein
MYMSHACMCKYISHEPMNICVIYTYRYIYIYIYIVYTKCVLINFTIIQLLNSMYIYNTSVVFADTHFMKCKMFRNYLWGFVSSLKFSRERSCDKRLLAFIKKLRTAFSVKTNTEVCINECLKNFAQKLLPARKLSLCK